MSNMINLPWISHNLTVLDSNDPTLVGLSGTVVNETKKTIIIRNTCGLPQEVCICQEIAKEQQKAVISVVRRRYGKMVTTVEGIEDSAIDLGQLAKILKGACASGGTVKGRTIELQGDHKKKVAKVLEQNGYKVEVR